MTRPPAPFCPAGALVAEPLKRRILDSIARTPRLGRFAHRVGKMLDLSAETAAIQLLTLDDPNAFVPGPYPGVAVRPVDGGPGLSRARAAYVRLARGCTVPTHCHLGHEATLVLIGRCLDLRTGAITGPGSVVVAPPGSTHAVAVLPGPAALLLVVEYGENIAGCTVCLDGSCCP